MPSFSVLTERWIPATDHAGNVQEYGVLELLERAGDLDAVVDAAPPIQFGLYRLLVAFVMDALKPKGLDELEPLLVAGCFDMAAIACYVAECGPGRFDLFDPSTPFLQTYAEEAKSRPVANLLPHLPSGSFATHFHHWREGDHAFSPAVCARVLTAIAPFMTAGGAGYSPSINGVPPWYVLIRGADASNRGNLFQTLVLNCYVGETPGLRGKGIPAWRLDKPVVAKQDAYCESVLEGLTWRPRLVRLIPGEGGTCTYTGRESPVLVREVLWGPGLAFVGQENWTDPNVAYVYSAKGRSPLRPQEDKELWRDTGPLLLLRREQHGEGENKVAFDRPALIDQLRRLRDDYDLFTDRRFDCIEAYSLRTDGKMKVFEWQYERLDIPAGVLRNRLAPGQVRTAIEMAEGAAWCVKDGLSRAYPRDGEGNQKAFGRIIQEAQRQYWVDLRAPFRSDFLAALAAQNPDDDAARTQLLSHWGQTIQGEAKSRFEEAVDPLDADAGALRRQALARAEFTRRLRWVATPPALRTDRGKRERRAAGHGG